MRKDPLTTVANVLVTAFATTKAAAAKEYRHHQCGYGPHYDYSYSNVQSPWTYIYPSANWRPFFQCHRYYGRIYPQSLS
jgi:hypothetical protein